MPFKISTALDDFFPKLDTLLASPVGRSVSHVPAHDFVVEVLAEYRANRGINALYHLLPAVDALIEEITDAGLFDTPECAACDIGLAEVRAAFMAGMIEIGR